MFFQPFRRNVCVGTVMKGPVHTGDAFGVPHDGADVVADQDDGAFAVDLFQQGIQSLGEEPVDVGVRLVKDKHLRIRDQGTAQQCALHLAAAQLSDGAPFQSFQSHADNGAAYLFMLFRGERAEQWLLPVEARQYGLVDGDGEFPVDGAVLRQVADADPVCPFSLAEEHDFSGHGFQQPQHHLDQRGLSPAVRSDDADEVVRIYLEADIPEHGFPFVSARKV